MKIQIDKIIFSIAGNEVTLAQLQADVQAAKDKRTNRDDFQFTTDTVNGLLNFITDNVAENVKLESADLMIGREDIEDMNSSFLHAFKIFEYTLAQPTTVIKMDGTIVGNVIASTPVLVRAMALLVQAKESLKGIDAEYARHDLHKKLTMVDALLGLRKSESGSLVQLTESRIKALYLLIEKRKGSSNGNHSQDEKGV